MDGYLDNVVGTVEADSYAKHMLWREYAFQAGKFALSDSVRYNWKDTGYGYGAHVGDIDCRPIWISLLTATVADKHLLFWHATSPVVDYDMVDTWLMKNCPKAVRADGYLNRTDPTNFCNILR